MLLHLTEAKAFEPIWSDDIHVEWMRSLHSSMGIPIDKIEYRPGEMERAFPAANVPVPVTLVATIQGVSKTAARRKDAHVVATAVTAKESVVVTHNISDFSPRCSAVMAWPKSGLTPSARGYSPAMRRRSSLEYACTGQPQEDADVANPVHRPSRRRPAGHARVGSRIGVTRPGAMRRVHHWQYDPGRWWAHPGDDLECDRRGWKHTGA